MTHRFLVSTVIALSALAATIADTANDGQFGKKLVAAGINPTTKQVHLVYAADATWKNDRDDVVQVEAQKGFLYLGSVQKYKSKILFEADAGFDGDLATKLISTLVESGLNRNGNVDDAILLNPRKGAAMVAYTMTPNAAAASGFKTELFYEGTLARQAQRIIASRFLQDGTVLALTTDGFYAIEIAPKTMVQVADAKSESVTFVTRVNAENKAIDVSMRNGEVIAYTVTQKGNIVSMTRVGSHKLGRKIAIAGSPAANGGDTVVAFSWNDDKQTANVGTLTRKELSPAFQPHAA